MRSGFKGKIAMLRISITAFVAFFTFLGPVVAQPDHVSVALGDVSLQKVPFLIAADAGIYAKNGLEVHQFITPNAAKVAQSRGIVVPAEYIGTPGEEAPISAGGGAPLVYQAIQPGAKPHRIIVATNENIVRDHIVARADIRTEQDLKGKTFATGHHDVPDYAGQAYLQRLGLENDVTTVRGATLDELKAGKVDAMLANLYVIIQARQQGMNDLVDLAKYNIPEAGSGISVEPDFIKAHRDIVARFVKSSVEATALMKSDKKVFAAALAKWFGINDPKLVDRLFALGQDFPDKPYPAADGIAAALKLWSSPGTVQAKAEDFYDPSFIAALDKDGTFSRLSKAK